MARNIDNALHSHFEDNKTTMMPPLDEAADS